MARNRTRIPEVRRPRRITVDDLPIADLIRKLEQVWTPSGDEFLLPGSVGRTALQGNVDPLAPAPVVWRSLPKTPDWQAWPDPNHVEGYTIRNGVVQLRGLVTKPGSAWTTSDPIGTLPAGFRPGSARIFPAIIWVGGSPATFGVARITVYATGGIVFHGMYAGSASSWNSSNWVALDAIQFFAEK